MRAKEHILLTLMAIGTVLFLPLLVPAAIVVSTLDTHRRRKAAANFSCLKCGAVLGATAVKLADRAWRKHMSEQRRKHPRVKFRAIQSCHAICPACGARYSFISEKRTFAIEAQRPGSRGARCSEQSSET